MPEKHHVFIAFIAFILGIALNGYMGMLSRIYKNWKEKKGD